jgi:hypothetical protein
MRVHDGMSVVSVSLLRSVWGRGADAVLWRVHQACAGSCRQCGAADAVDDGRWLSRSCRCVDM